jgi:hypothetical protein
MIIDKDGNILEGWWEANGPVIKDGEFNICIPYNDSEMTKKWIYIYDLKKQLSDTDFNVLKHMEGSLSDEKWEKIKEQRQQWRAEINSVEATMTVPTLTAEEIKRAEEIAISNWKNMTKGDDIS